MSIFRIYVSFFLCLLYAGVQGQSPPLSINWYRIPYADGTSITVTRDFIDHGNTPAGNTGPMDIVASQANAVIVAAADGVVRVIQESRTECGCNAAYGGCANSIQIEHANGEWTRYLHIQANSATNAGIVVGSVVSRGDPIGLEGDVGWTCGNGRNANSGACVASVPAGAGKCGRHLHFEVRRGQNGPFVNPKFCTGDVASDFHIFEDNATYTANECGSACDGSVSFPLTESNTMKVYAVSGNLTSVVDVQSSASIEYQATGSITLNPGFNATTGAYFRAAIASCANPQKKEEEKKIAEERSGEPAKELLLELAPNPVAAGISSRVAFTLVFPGAVTLCMYDVLGRESACVVNNQPYPDGRSEIELPTAGLPGGIYWVRLFTDGGTVSKRLIITGE